VGVDKQHDILSLSIGWWFTLLMLGPLLWVQGRWARLRTPRLPPLPPPLAGTSGEGATELRLLVLGESPAAGVGVDTHADSLPAQLAAELARRQRRRVYWRSLAENGADAQRVLDTQLPLLDGEMPDLVLVVLGVNDTTGLTPRARWRARLAALADGIRQHGVSNILFTSVPRMDSFTALPQPLRSALGWRARLLDHDLRALAAAIPGARCAAPLPRLTPAQLSADGYHPSAQACRDWARQLAGHLPVLPR
jgi:lysophospholipase L1-like esterase